MVTVSLEVCVDSIEGLLASVQNGADRVELCSALSVGGLTPSPGIIKFAQEQPIPVYAMIRPRENGFIYTETELECMCREINAVREAGLSGVVFGANLSNGRLDEHILKKLMKRAQGLGTTLHRAFDLVPDIREALDTAEALGFERVLTSGRAIRAFPDGMADLKLAFQYREEKALKIKIMPGAGLNAQNLPFLFEALPTVQEVHASCSETLARDFYPSNTEMHNSKLSKESIESQVKLPLDYFDTGKRISATQIRAMKDACIKFAAAHQSESETGKI